MLWARRRPETKRAIHVHPGVIFASDRSQLSEKIESADIQITSLQQHDCGLARIGCECLRQCFRFEPAGLVAGQRYESALANPQNSNGSLD